MARDNPRGRPRLWHLLAFRFGLVLCLGVAALFVLMGLWNLATQREHMLRLTSEAADRSSALIRAATRDGMLHNDPDRIATTVQAIARSEGVRRVRILDRDGVVRHASDPNGKGEQLPITSFQCQVCHATEPLPAALENERRLREIQGPGGEPILNVVEPIPNEPACSAGACHEHPDDRRVLGIIDIELPLDGVNRLLDESSHQVGWGLLLTLVALLALTAFLSWRMVVRPVHALAAAADRVSAGDLSARVESSAPDEVGRLGRQWNTMVGELQKARGELEQWARTLEVRVDEKTEELEAAHGRMLVVEKMAALGKLAAVVAHEINNPLAGIATYARLMRKRCEGEAEPNLESIKALELMETEATRCGTIVRNLLMFSRTPGARFAPEALGPILERCAMLVHHKADLQEVEIVVYAPPEMPKVECDAAQIQQVVLALIMNAIEAMPHGGTLTLSVLRDEARDGVIVEVLDTGVGIEHDQLAHIFEPFYSTKEQGEGVGLGLSVVYGIVERHRGEVRVNSILGKGTRFRVHLPFHQPSSDEEQAEADAAEGKVS